MKNLNLTIYKEKFCRIIVEKKQKKAGRHECLFCTIKSVNEKCVYVIDSRGAWFKIPIKSIKGIQENEEYW